MALKQKKDGSFVISSRKEAVEAAKLIEERVAAVAEIEAEMEEDYELQSMRQEAIALQAAITVFMRDNDVEKTEAGNVYWKLVRPVTRRWNADKLKAKLGKAKYLQVCDVVPNAQKIDDAVREGKIDLKKIEAALEEEPKSAYVKRYENREAKGSDEADALKKAMS